MIPDKYQILGIMFPMYFACCMESSPLVQYMVRSEPVVHTTWQGLFIDVGRGAS